MTTVQDLQKQFHCCMPLFIALGDKVRLSIVELLTEAAVRSEDPQGTIDFEGHAMNVNEITRRTSLSRPAISHHLKILKDAISPYVPPPGLLWSWDTDWRSSCNPCIILFFPDILIDAKVNQSEVGR